MKKFKEEVQKMAYQQNIPQSTDTLNVSQGDIQANFQAIYDLIGVNHANFDTSMSLLGKHNFVSFPNQAAMPAFLTGEEGLYNFIYPKTAVNELYVHKQTAGAGLVEVPMTASILSTTASPSGNGWTYLPSGILMIWFRATASSAGYLTIDIPSAYPSFPVITKILSVQASINTPNPAQNLAVTVLQGPASGPTSPTSVYLYISQRTTTTAASGVANVFVIGY